jgi:hypothetical protein
MLSTHAAVTNVRGQYRERATTVPRPHRYAV